MESPSPSTLDSNAKVYKTFQWINQQAGNGHMNGILYIYPDGHAHFDCTTWIVPSGSKVGWHEVIEVYDAGSKSLFKLGVWDSPPMDAPPDGGQYHWTTGGTFPAGSFNDAVSAKSTGTCP
jgi:hypothetical protein